MIKPKIKKEDINRVNSQIDLHQNMLDYLKSNEKELKVDLREFYDSFRISGWHGNLIEYDNNDLMRLSDKMLKEIANSKGLERPIDHVRYVFEVDRSDAISFLLDEISELNRNKTKLENEYKTQRKSEGPKGFLKILHFICSWTISTPQRFLSVLIIMGMFSSAIAAISYYFSNDIDRLFDSKEEATEVLIEDSVDVEK